MEKSNSKQLKRDCFIALLIPVALLSLVQIGVKQDWSAWWLITIAVMGASLLGRHIYQFFNRLEDMTWQEQLASLVKRVTTPVLIANINHEITYANDSFNRLPLSTIQLQYQRLPELLASQNPILDLSERCKTIAHYADMLENLSTKVKTNFELGENSFEWTLLPLFSPTGQRWGTLIECTTKTTVHSEDSGDNNGLPMTQILEQLSAPFMFVGIDEKVLYVNLSLKMLLTRHKGIIQYLCPKWDISDPTGDSLNYFLTLIEKENVSFNELVKSGKIDLNLRDEKYVLSFQTLNDFHNKVIGTVVFWQDLALTHKNDLIVSQAIMQAIHPLVILDSHGKIKEINPAMIRILDKGEGTGLLSETLNSKSFIDVVEEFVPSIFTSFCNALKNNKTVRIIAEHHQLFCDWIINPVREQEKVVGYIVEIIYPSRQLHLGFEESFNRMHQKRQAIEQELKLFTSSIAKLNLYQKEKLPAQFNIERFNHPLLRNSAKIIIQLAESLQNIHIEFDKVRGRLNSGTMIDKSNIITTPLKEVNVLSSSIARNVQEIQFDFYSINRELNTLKSLVKEHKSLNYAYVKPIQEAIQATENTLLQTLGYTETVTLVVHHLHEINAYLTKLQGSLSVHLSPKIASEVSAILESIKIDLQECKDKLCIMIPEYEKLKESWRQASKSLTSCLILTENVEQASDRWSSTSLSACEYSEKVERHLQHLFSLTEKLRLKTVSMEQLHSPTGATVESSGRKFDKVVLEIEESKKKAEDVLFEGIKKA